MSLDVRRLAAVDMYGRTGSARRRSLVRAEFIVGAMLCTALGLLGLLSRGIFGLAAGAWLLGAGLNYAALAVNARSLSQPGALETELAGVDRQVELRRACISQLWIAVPLAVATAGAVQAIGRKHAT